MWDETTSSLFYDSNEANRKPIISLHEWIEQTETVTHHNKNIKLPSVDGTLYVSVNAFAEDRITGEEIRTNYTILAHKTEQNKMIPFGTYTPITLTPNKVEFVSIEEPTEDNYSFMFKFNSQISESEFNVEFAFVNEKFVLDYYADGTIGEVPRHPVIVHQYDQAAFVNMKNVEQFRFIAVFTQNLVSEISCNGVVLQANKEQTTFKLPQLKYFIDGFGEQMFKVYGLESSNQNHTALEIEYATKYDSPIEFIVFSGDVEIPCETTEYIGKKVMLCDITGFGIEFSLKINLEVVFIGGATQAVIFKYKTLDSKASSKPFNPDNSSLNVLNNDGEFMISIPNAAYGHPSSFIYKLFDKAEGATMKEINTIYDSILAEVTGSFNYPEIRNLTESNGFEETIMVSLELSIDKFYFLVVTEFYTNSTTGEEFKCNFEIYGFTTKEIACDLLDYGQYNVKEFSDYKGEKLAFYTKINENSTTYVTVHLKLSNVKYSDESADFQNRFNVDGYIVDSEFINNRLQDDQLLPDETAIKVQGEQYLFEHEIILKFKDLPQKTDRQIFIEFSLDTPLNDDLYYKTITLNIGIFDNEQIIPLDLGDHHVNMLDDQKNQTTYKVEVPEHNTKSIYIEFGERYNTKKIVLTASTSQNELNMTEHPLPGKRAYIINNISNPLLYLTFTNTKFSLVEYFVKVLIDTEENIRNYMEYNIVPKFSPLNKAVSFDNILNKINRIYDTGYTSIQYKIVLYNKDESDEGNVEDLESLFLNKLGDEPKFNGFEASKELQSELVTKDTKIVTVDLKDVLIPDKTYFIQITYHSDSLITSNNEMHRFAFKNIPAQVVSYPLKEIQLEDVHPICFETHINKFGFYFSFDQNRTIAPQISLRYYNIKYSHDEQISTDIFNIHGYTVSRAFIDEKKENDDAQVDEPGVEANYLIEDKLAFLSFEDLSINEYVFVDISRGNDNMNEYENICFEIIPETGNAKLEQSIYYYNKLLPEQNLTFRIERETPKQKFFTIEVIKNSPEITVQIALEEVTEIPSKDPFEIVEMEKDNLKRQFNIDATKSDSLVYLLHISKKSIPSEQTRSLAEKDDDFILVKYNLYENDFPEEITFEKELSVERSQDKLTITFDNINKENRTLTEIIYQVNVFTNETAEPNAVDKYMLDTSKVKPIYSDSKIINSTNNISFTFPLSEETDRNDLYVVLHATIGIDKEKAIKLKYNLATVASIIDPSDPSDPSDPDNTELPWWMFVIIGVAVIAVILIVVLIAKCRRKRNRGFNIEKIQSSNEMKLIDEEKRD